MTKKHLSLGEGEKRSTIRQHMLGLINVFMGPLM